MIVLFLIFVTEKQKYKLDLFFSELGFGVFMNVVDMNFIFTCTLV